MLRLKKTITGQSKHHVDHAIDVILAERERLKEAKDALQCLLRPPNRRKSNDAADDDRETQIEETRLEIKELTARVKALEKALGVSSREGLEKLKGDEFLTVSMNLQALRTRIRTKLVHHMFERGRLQGAGNRDQIMRKCLFFFFPRKQRANITASNRGARPCSSKADRQSTAQQHNRLGNKAQQAS